MVDSINHLFGSCACERNQYEVLIPSSDASLAQVFFDNSALSRRTQASPVTAWLRVPLDWYSSTTIAHFPDETHGSIKRTFHTPASNPALPPTRRQFCGYCGSHLTQWNEGLHAGYTTTRPAGYLDVTLGSLLNESLDKLEALSIIPDLEENDDEEEEEEERPARGEQGLRRGGIVNTEDHIPTNEQSAGRVDARTNIAARAMQPPHLMSNRGMPYFEELVENSRLGRIKRQIGGHTSQDGSTSVQWEVVEIGGSGGGVVASPEPMSGVDTTSSGNKRPKLDL